MTVPVVVLYLGRGVGANRRRRPEKAENARRGSVTAAVCVIAIILASPARAQFGPQQTKFRNSVQSLTGTLDVHGVASGAVTGAAGTTQYTTDQHVNGTLNLDHYNSLTGAFTGTLTGTIVISEQSITTFGCTLTNTYAASTSAQSDFLGQPLMFNLSFDIGSDTWSLWPSNNSVNGTVTSVQECAGQEQTSTATNPLSFMPIDMKMGFPFPTAGFDLAGTGHVLCDGCGNAASNPVNYTFTYNLKATLNPCADSLSSASQGFTSAASTGSITVTTGDGCTWTVGLPLDSWVNVTSPLSSSGTGTVRYSVAANNTGAARSTSLTVAGQTVILTQWAPGTVFVPVTPCRIADTRNPVGTFGGPVMPGGSSRAFPIPQSACGIPNSALAYSLNVTVAPRSTLSYLTLSPAGQPRPFVSTLNSFTGKVVANAALVPAGSGGAVDVFVTDTTDVILDINGYFAPAGAAGGLAFYPVTPCRISDTRNPAGPFGGPSLSAGTTSTISVPSSACGVPASAMAYSLNATVVPKGGLQYLTLWPAGRSQPLVSTLNSFDGSIVANAAIVPAGDGGGISAYVTDATDLILDINGYFAAPGAGGMSFYPATPCRISDTRNAAGTFGGPILEGGSMRDFPVPSGGCSIPSEAQAYSLNATVVPSGMLAYLTLWPAGAAQPFVSTLNSFGCGYFRTTVQWPG
jgi:hypothetical protein